MRGDNKNSLGPPVYNPNGTSNSSSVFVGRYVYNNRPHLCTACMRCGLIIISVLMPITLTSTEAGVRGGSFQERGKFSGGGVHGRCTGGNVLRSRRRGWSVVLASVIRRSHRVGAALITGRPAGRPGSTRARSRVHRRSTGSVSSAADNRCDNLISARAEEDPARPGRERRLLLKTRRLAESQLLRARGDTTG